jgi:GntR family transcriptional regulator
LDGNIKEGEALPSVRKVAAEYQLNPVTIPKVYQMLQNEQYVEKKRDKGLPTEWPLILQKISYLNFSVEELLCTTKENE